MSVDRPVERLLVILIAPFVFGVAMAEEGPGTLKALFVYKADVANLDGELATICAPPRELQGVPVIAAEIVVGLAAKAAESIVDAVAARTQPQATTLEATVPLDGFYDQNGNIAVAGGCLIVHNAAADDTAKSIPIKQSASIFGAFRLVPSFDRSAFRLDVVDWQFTRFLEPSPKNWFQNSSKRDFILKIELLTPSSADLGRQAVFIEQTFEAVTVKDIAGAFIANERLPWFASPPRPADLPIQKDADKHAGRYMPLNLRVTIVETTKPNQLAQWTQDIAKEKKSDISKLAQDAVRDALVGSNPSATDKAKSANDAAAAFAAYKDSWDAATAFRETEPAAPSGDADAKTKQAYEAQLRAWQANMNVKLRIVSANRELAKQAFSSANLSWPGDLPVIPVS